MTLKSHQQKNNQLKWWGCAIILASIILAFAWPYDHRRLRITDPWTYEVAAENFSKGLIVLNTEQMAENQTYVRLSGGILSQYLEIREKEWVLRQSFGYPLLIAPFKRLGLPHIINAILAISSLWLTYTVLRRWFVAQPHLAIIGTTLLVTLIPTGEEQQPIA